MDPLHGTPDLTSLFLQYSVHGFMDPLHFSQFLLQVQGEHHISEIQAAHLMESSSSSSSTPRFDKHDFLHYLFDVQHNCAIDSSSSVHHDMTAPLAHYYIFTGHNSYLTGNQLSSACSEKPIAEALRRGVRVVELDLWPDSDKKNVLVYHGRTLTTPVDLETCLGAIKENAFVKTDYPVIVTLEDHLPRNLQATAAELILEILGSVLFYPENAEQLKSFPSPESLRGKILISTKPPKEFLGSPPAEAQTQAGETDLVHQLKQGNEHFCTNQGTHPVISFTINGNVAGGTSSGNGELSSDEEIKPPEIRQAGNVASEYGRLISIRAGKPKAKSLLDAIKVEEFVRRVSLSEPELAEVAKLDPQAVVQFTHENFLRIYPYGLRFDSSNYNPILAWAHGAQMVAANMQGYGRHLWVAQGFFRANGGCGYVKKPDFLLPQCASRFVNMYDPENPLPVKRKLKIKICTGCGWRERYGEAGLDAFNEPDLYVHVGIAGIEADTVMKKTTSVDNSWVPMWEEELEFEMRVPEIAVLQLEVRDEDTSARDDFAGQVVLPVSELKPGYRVVNLCDEKGDEMEAVKLLVHLQLSS